MQTRNSLCLIACKNPSVLPRLVQVKINLKREYDLQDFLFVCKVETFLVFLDKTCFSYVFYKHKACVYCVFCALFSCMCLVRLMLRNRSENKYVS